jgi:diguanylate cyclase (GGDEF)-like protein/PAS domain S-box-containing protein
MTMSDDARPDLPSDFSLPAGIERLCMRNLLANTEDKIFFKDRQSRFLLVSQGFLAAQGHGSSLEELIGRTDFDIFSAPHAAAAFEDEQRVIETGEPMIAKVERETFHDRPDAWVSTTKLPLRDQRGKIIGTWGIARDITARVEAEQALAEQALRDAVTGLANRVALMDRLARALVALERRPGCVAVLFADIDNFKEVNDSLGHDAGDRVLIEVGRRLTQVARRVDTVARLGGDEFVLLCPELSDDDDIRLISDRIIHTIRAPLRIDHRDLTVTASLGATATSDPHADPGELLRRADIAMYGAKRAGRNGFQVFSTEVHLAKELTSDLAVELRRAIDPPGAVRALPATIPSRRRRSYRSRSVGPLAPSPTRGDAPSRIHSSSGGTRSDRGDRLLRARGGVPAASDLASRRCLVG